MVLLVGPSPSRPRAKRRTLGYFAPVGWSVPQSDGRGGSPAPESPIAEADEDEERYTELAVRAEAILLGLAQLYREMSSTRGEVFIATEPVARDATDMFAVLLHEAAHTIASRRGIKDTSRQGRYHNGRFRMIAEDVGLEGGRDPERGWSLTGSVSGSQGRVPGHARAAEGRACWATRTAGSRTYRRRRGPCVWVRPMGAGDPSATAEDCGGHRDVRRVRRAVQPERLALPRSWDRRRHGQSDVGAGSESSFDR